MRKAIFLAALVGPLAAAGQETAPRPADLAAPPPAVAAPSGSPAEPPAVTTPAPAPAAAKEHGVFPLWSDWIREKGFALPEPFGVMVNYYYQRSDIVISNLKLGFNGGPMYDASKLISIPSAQTRGAALSVRPNVMILPFLSVYGVFSVGDTETNVHITEPVEFTTLAKSGAQVVALGTTLQMGYKGVFGVADFNFAVADVERLADAVGSNMLSFRLGYNFGTPGGKGFALWAGTAGQVLETDTRGSVRLGEVLPPPQQSTIDGVQAKCDAIPPLDPSKVLCNAFVGRLQDWHDNGYDGTVQYSLDKRPKGIWNMVLGAQYALDRQWQFRVETTFLNGRTTFLAATEYRWNMF